MRVADPPVNDNEAICRDPALSFVEKYVRVLCSDYVEAPPPAGTCQASELAMHCRYWKHRALRLWVKPGGLYAVVEMDNGKIANGCWNVYANGDWCVA